MESGSDRQPSGWSYHPRTERHRKKGRGRLRLRDASAMAIGGMIGGGIFTVLGETIRIAGHLAFLTFVLAGALAGLTAHSYAALARRTGRSGGPDLFLREEGHPELAALTSWFLALGYVATLAVYAFTFGHYLESVTGGGLAFARFASAAIIALFLVVNLRGVGASSLTEDAIVFTKLLILVTIAGVGMWSWSSARLEPLADVGIGGVLVGAGSIFMAYEGFELLSYDYDDIERPDHNLPRALYLSVAVVVAVYVIVTLGSQMLVSDELIVQQREVAFAAVGEQALGTVGRFLAVGGAVLATSSAINATLFSAARLVRDLTTRDELPNVLGTTRRGLPTTAMWLLAVLAGGFAMAPDVEQLLAFGSVTFLTVFALVNQAYARTARTVGGQIVGFAGAAACAGAVGVVVVDLARHDPAALAVMGVPVAVVLALRVLYRRTRPHSDSPGPTT